MKIAILGYGSQGASALEYWGNQGYEVTVCDQNTIAELPSGVSSSFGENYLENLDQFDLIVRSPSIHPRDIVSSNSSEILDKVTTVTNEFLKVCPTKNIIGVTGTKGKGTTSTLITKILEAAGKKVHLGGNIGIPPLEMLKNNIGPADWVVLELANFQLIDLKASPVIAVCLMVVPEHQDWHKDVSEYIEAKQQLFKWQSADDTAIYYGLDPTSEHVASVSPGHQIPYMRHPGADVIDGKVVMDGHTLCDITEVKLLGEHNWQNICAAVTAVWQITQDTDAIRSVITTFSGMEYRLELIRELNGVRYYNDSFGTTPETAIVAIQAFKEPKVVILGGSDKGADFSGLAEVIADSNVRSAIVIGAIGPSIIAALKEKGYENIVLSGENMEKIVNDAKSQAQPGDVVLLSTASASFDMFKNYQDRGDQFNQVVLALV